jgi:hypothetical protein
MRDLFAQGLIILFKAIEAQIRQGFVSRWQNVGPGVLITGPQLQTILPVQHLKPKGVKEMSSLLE